ncbi:unnamed protein product [Caenorhabditis bovis]|uniref:guanylate cyclase n=1 Tax=Caenorhabditis bovis TaxID=2654633 RepID=A0A8S1EEN7_9PELO|nr:unnamed protein product [Caenorhabditis bovis]
MLWIGILLLIFAYEVSNDHVTFLGRYTCNVNFEEEYCTRDTYVGLAFYYGLIDGGGVRKNGTFINSNVTVNFFDPTVQGNFSNGTDHYSESVLDMLLNEDPNDPMLAVIGVESQCQQVAALAQAFEKASLLLNCEDEVGEAHMPSETAAQLASTQGSKYRAFAKMAKSLGWTNVAVINFEDDTSNDKTYHNQLLDALSKEAITLDYVKKGGFSASQTTAMFSGLESIVDVVMDSYLKTRIYVLVMDYPGPTQLFMNVMSSMGLLETGRYFVIIIGTVQSDYLLYFSFNRNRNYSDEWLGFQDRVNNDAHKTFCPPLCETKAEAIAENSPFDPHSYWETETTAIANAYDLGLVLSETVAVHGVEVLKDAITLVNYMGSRAVSSLLGYVAKFSASRVLQRQYIVWSPQDPSSDKGPLEISIWAQIAAKLSPDGKGGYQVAWRNLTQLGVINGKLPSSRPKCGFNDELCPKDLKLEIIIICVCALAILVLVGVIVYIIKWISYERRLESSYYLVNRKEVQLIDMTSFGSSRAGSMFQSAMSIKSVHDDSGPGGVNLQFYNHGIRRAARQRRMRNETSNANINRESWLEIEEWHLAKFDTAIVTVRKIKKSQLKLTREMKQEIDYLMTETHENLNKFLGLINEGDLIFTIHLYGPRKSMNDLLRNQDLRLDRMFQISFVEDIMKGLAFLHDGSKIGYHGNLKSTNCVVDAYWRIKLSSFGMEKIRQDEPRMKADDQLWSAPEIVRRYCVKYDLSKDELRKADIYSFAIVLYEIFGRQGPYGDDLLDSDEIIEQIKFPEGGAITRPDIHLITKAPHPVCQVVEKCWNEDSFTRPTIKKVREMLKPLSCGMKGNIADNIMQLLDRYRNNLEDVIKERTEQLEDEKKRNENLLLQLLPKTVAANLKNGKPVEAEFFSSVTIYFSDIVGFTSLSSKSTSLQIVNMLNSLYTIFDTIIDKFDCYKVETIGDAYMFVSGLPELNGYLHAGEVAGASLELLESIRSFSVSHAPDEKLRLRIGNHTGSVVTGVVGIKMPRYCLFGESVITANFMESSGEAMRIQMSSSTYELILKCGGHDVQPREKITLKNKMEVMTYWLNSYSREARIARLKQFIEQYPHLQRLIMKQKKLN